MRCPFCLGALPNHSPQCFHKSVPKGNEVEETRIRKAKAEADMLDKVIVDDNKYVYSGNGINVKSKLKGEKQ